MKVNSFVKASFLSLALSILLSGFAYAQTATAPANGDGTSENPYEIATLENLYWLSQNNAEWDKHYIQTADIDASETSEWNDGKGFSRLGHSTTPFTGVYDGQKHYLDGLYMSYDSDYIGMFGYISSNSQGGPAIIKELALKNVYVRGNEYVGALVAYSDQSEIYSCASSGTVISDVYNANCGGLVGYNNDGLLQNSYSKASSSANNLTGGLLGYNRNGVVRNCYSSGRVLGGETQGGLVGFNNDGNVYYSFWNTETSLQEESGGGTGITIDEMQTLSTFTDAGWSFADKSGKTGAWAMDPDINNGYPYLAGHTSYEFPALAEDLVFGDIDTSLIQITGLTDIDNEADGYIILINSEDSWTPVPSGSELTVQTEWKNEGQQCVYSGPAQAMNVLVTKLTPNTIYAFKVFAFNTIDDVKHYANLGLLKVKQTPPRYSTPMGSGTILDPYRIASLENLSWISLTKTAWDRHYVQTADIDASPTRDWFEGNGFMRIGNNGVKFTGTYNGKGHVIDSLYINRPDSSAVGLFGFIEEGTARVDSLGITNAEITGSHFVGILTGRLVDGMLYRCYTSGSATALDRTGGGLIGHNLQGEVRECNSSGIITVVNNYVGGLIGYDNTGAIYDSYSDGEIMGNNYSGGLIGKVRNSSLYNCYSRAYVGSSSMVGGLVGTTEGTIVEEDCFYDTEATSCSRSYLGTAMTTEEMTNSDNFLNAGYDFVFNETNGTEEIWAQNDSLNNGYLFHAWSYEGPIPVSETLDTLKGACSVEVLETPKATGIYGDTITATTNDPLEYTAQGEFIIEWLFEEGHYENVQVQKVVVADLELPVLTAIEDQTVEIEADKTVYTVSGTEFDIAEYSDNCEVVSIVNDFNDGETLAGAEFPEGTTTVTWTVSDAAGNTAESSYDVTVTIAETTSNEEIDPANVVMLYPNPVKNTLNIALDGQMIDRIEILDVTGKMIIEQKVKQYQTEMDMSSARKGVYFVRIYASNKIITRKLLKN